MGLTRFFLWPQLLPSNIVMGVESLFFVRGVGGPSRMEDLQTANLPVHGTPYPSG